MINKLFKWFRTQKDNVRRAELLSEAYGKWTDSCHICSKRTKWVLVNYADVTINLVGVATWKALCTECFYGYKLTTEQAWSFRKELGEEV